MAQEIENKEPISDNRVKPQDNVTLYATEGSVRKTGTKFTAHRILAEKLIANGKATKTAPKKEGKEGDGGKA